MNKYKILFPSYPGSINKIEPDFENEYNVAKTLGFDIILFDHEELVANGEIICSNLKDSGGVLLVILRGWMLAPKQYKRLYNYLAMQNHLLINNVSKYTNCHYLPHSYPLLMRYSPLTIWNNQRNTNTLKNMLSFMGGKDFIIKDYVKSEKAYPRLFKFDGDVSIEEFEQRVKEFVKERGTLFNKGTVLRQFVDLAKYDEEVNEWRGFFLCGKLISLTRNSNIKQNSLNRPSDRLVKKIARDIHLFSNFFTIDFAEKQNGEWMVVETGDGQVSGLTPNQNPIGLFNNFK